MKLRIYKNNYGWQSTAKGKDKDGKEIKGYISVKFAKTCGDPEGDKATVVLKDAFFTAFNTKNGVGTGLVVMDWELDQEDMAKSFANDNAVTYTDIKQDDLPFF